MPISPGDARRRKRNDRRILSQPSTSNPIEAFFQQHCNFPPQTVPHRSGCSLMFSFKLPKFSNVCWHVHGSNAFMFRTTGKYKNAIHQDSGGSRVKHQTSTDRVISHVHRTSCHKKKRQATMPKLSPSEISVCPFWYKIAESIMSNPAARKYSSDSRAAGTLSWEGIDMVPSTATTLAEHFACAIT